MKVGRERGQLLGDGVVARSQLPDALPVGAAPGAARIVGEAGSHGAPRRRAARGRIATAARLGPSATRPPRVPCMRASHRAASSHTSNSPICHSASPTTFSMNSHQRSRAGVDARAVVLGGSEPGAVEQIAIDVDLAQRLIEQLGLGRQRVLVQRGAAEVLQHQPQARAVRERDVELLEREAGPVGARAALQARDRHRSRPCGRRGPARASARTSVVRAVALVDVAHVPPTRSSSRVSTRSESRCASASARAAPAWRS